MSYVIVRTGGEYVSRAVLNTRGASYSRNLREAVVFESWEAAERERCPENERVVSVGSQLSGFWVQGDV